LCLFFILANVFLGAVCNAAALSHSWEGGWDTGVGRSSSSQPNGTILIEKLLAGLSARKKSVISEFAEFTSMEKYKKYISLTAFGEVKKLRNLSATIFSTLN
jgi:hypothetical protein